MTERTASAGGVVGDELADPQAYQRRLVGLVGDDDPAAVQAATSQAWRALVDEAGPDLRTRPAPGEWSVLECLGHALDGELVMSGRYRWALAEDDPEIVGYDQDRWVTAARPRPGRPWGSAAPLRRAACRESRAVERDGAGPAGTHRAPPRAGPRIDGLMFTMTAGHDRFHLAQARRALTSVRAG